MTGYDKKKLTLSADQNVVIDVEIDVDHEGWKQFKQIDLKAGKDFVFDFPQGFNAHWIRFKANKACAATAQLEYK